MPRDLCFINTITDWHGVKYETPIVNDETNPVWHHTITLHDLAEEDLDKEVAKLERLKKKKIPKIPYGTCRVTLWDWGEKNSSKFLCMQFILTLGIDFLGHCYIDIVSLLSNSADVTAWFQLEASKVCSTECVGGEIQIHINGTRSEVLFVS